MKKEFNFFDRPGNVSRTRVVFYAVLIILVFADLFVPKHPNYAWEKLPGSYAVYGFLSCAVIIAVSKALGRLWLQKREDYYD